MTCVGQSPLGAFVYLCTSPFPGFSSAPGCTIFRFVICGALPIFSIMSNKGRLRWARRLRLPTPFLACPGPSISFIIQNMNNVTWSPHLSFFPEHPFSCQRFLALHRVPPRRRFIREARSLLRESGNSKTGEPRVTHRSSFTDLTS